MAGAPWSVNDLLWEGLSEQALAAHERGRRAEAARLWRHAWTIALTIEPDDPRRAASLNNLGLADPADARRLADAVAAWQQAEGWVARMD